MNWKKFFEPLIGVGLLGLRDIENLEDYLFVKGSQKIIKYYGGLFLLFKKEEKEELYMRNFAKAAKEIVFSERLEEIDNFVEYTVEAMINQYSSDISGLLGTPLRLNPNEERLVLIKDKYRRSLIRQHLLQQFNEDSSLHFFKTICTIGEHNTLNDIVEYKQWLTLRDERVRYSHRKVHGQIVSSKRYFNVDGEKMRYPRDPMASPHNTINCRCYVNWLFEDQVDGFNKLAAPLRQASSKIKSRIKWYMLRYWESKKHNVLLFFNYPEYCGKFLIFNYKKGELEYREIEKEEIKEAAFWSIPISPEYFKHLNKKVPKISLPLKRVGDYALCSLEVNTMDVIPTNDGTFKLKNFLNFIKKPLEAKYVPVIHYDEVLNIKYLFLSELQRLNLSYIQKLHGLRIGKNTAVYYNSFNKYAPPLTHEKINKMWKLYKKLLGSLEV